MKRVLLIFSFLVFFTAGFSQIKTYDFDAFQPRLSTGSDSVYVVNFWATWCVPCVKELPEVEDHYLTDAIDALIEGRKPDPDFTRAIGCTIKYVEE